MITHNLLLLLLFIFLLIFPQTCHCMNPHICSPSSCGNIRNISFPFRLKHDPKHCGIPDYELSCESNVTLLYLNSEKYKVKAINYDNFTIRLVDVSINNTNTFSFPNHSLSSYNFSDGYPYSSGWWKPFYFSYYFSYPNIPKIIPVPINFMSCPHPLNNSSFFIETYACANRDRLLDDSSSSSNSRHTYIKAGHMNASDVRDMCRIDQIVMTSWKFQDLKNVSISEIHEALLYGFKLSWVRYPCRKCRRRSFCFIHEDNTASCNGDMDLFIDLPVVMIVVVFVGVSIPAKIILGFTCFFGLSFLNMGSWSSQSFVLVAEELERLGGYIVLSLVARLIIGFTCLMGFLIYKLRTRHLSMFDAIESFLRSDNKLVPIRYSYSDLKKMTGGFREKLGQGGYGTVYKGKLRSGYDVAVKLLGKPGGNGQDFMNEISTIGRIHHVNVVKLVGYCAERSKRALVYDFMPSGSLDKYIYKEDGENSLDWQTKYEIAIGVARGIEYLHRGCAIQILHFDIKPHNILLDDKFIPKISDFGLAKFYSTEKKTVTLTAARGTIGYVAPELINRGFGRVSYKADVYSFGMLLIELVCLKKDLRGNGEKSSKYFPDWIYDCFDQGGNTEIGEIVEEEDDNGDRRKIARKMTIVALWCIQMSPDSRPSMNKVLEMLEREVEHLQIPQRPTQSTQVVLDEDDQSWSTYSTDSASLLRHEAAPCFEITVQD